MDTNQSLINLGELAKPATTLIEKISEGIFFIFQPWHKKKMAEADVYEEKLHAMAEIEITVIQRRAMSRFYHEEAKKQNNMENIIAKALPEVTEQAKPDQVENDWIVHFFEKCRLISDDQMQGLWAKILAGQANAPGKYSKKTIDILSSIEKADAILFSKLCSFSVIIMDKILPLIYDINKSIYKENGIDFEPLSHLESLGLIHFDNIRGFRMQKLSQKGFIPYFESRAWIEFQKPEDNEIQLGKVLLTKAGQQLAHISDAQPIDGFIDYLKEKWKTFGYKTEPDSEQSAT